MITLVYKRVSLKVRVIGTSSSTLYMDCRVDRVYNRMNRADIECIISTVYLLQSVYVLQSVYGL